MVALAHLNVIETLPNVKEGCVDSLHNFVTKLNEAVDPLVIGNYKYELASRGLLGRLVKKMPHRLQSRCEGACRNGPIPPTVMLFCSLLVVVVTMTNLVRLQLLYHCRYINLIIEFQ